MAVLASDIISRALKALEVIGGNEPVNASDANDALIAFNAMLDSWSNEHLTCYQVQEQSFALQIGVQSYTIALGSTINVTRPISIESAYVQDTNLNNFPMNVVNREVWNRIGLRSVTSQIPDTLFYDPQYPVGIVNIFPSPLLAYTVFFDSYLPLTTFASLTTALSAPPGYERAYVFNLAVEISAMFSIPLPPAVLAIAKESLANIKRTNIRNTAATYDRYISSRASGTYNIYRDE